MAWRIWAITALPCFLVAMGFAGYQALRLPEVAKLTLAPISQQAHLRLEATRTALEQLAGGAAADMRPEELLPFPGVLTVAAWRTGQNAAWLYQDAPQQRWYRVVEAPGPPPVRTLHALSEPLPSATPTTLPGDWRAQGAALGAAMSQLRKHQDAQGRAFTWHWEEKLAVSGRAGYLLIALQELEGGNIRGSYLELSPEALVPAQDRGVPGVFLARQSPDGLLSTVGGDVPEDLPLNRHPFRDWEPIRLASDQGARWVAGASAALSGDERLFLGIVRPETDVLVRSFWPTLAGFGVGLALTLLVLATTPWLLRRPLRDLAAAEQAIRQLPAQQGPIYWPKTRVAELRQLFHTVEQSAHTLATRAELQQARGGVAIETSARPTLLVEAEVETASPAPAPSPPPAENEPAKESPYPATPPAAFIQAMESLRRQLSETRRELDHTREQQASTKPDPVAEASLAERLRAALFAFDAPAQAPGTLGTALEIAEHRSYSINEGFTEFHAEDGESVALPTVLLRTQHPLFFLAIARTRSLWVDDATADPRTASLFVGQTLPPATALVAILLEDDSRAWIGLRPHGGLGWRAAEQLFAEAIAQRTAKPEPAAATPTSQPVAEPVPPESAHALWAQPNLPSNPDAPIYRAITDNTAAGLITLSKDGRLTYVNAAAERIFMRPVGELMGQALVGLAMPEEVDGIQSSLAQVQAGAPMDERDVYFRVGDHQKALLRIYLTPLQDESGEPTGFAGTVLDVTALRAREIMLARQEAVYRGIVEGAPQLLWSVDAIGCITFVNHAAKEFYGYATEELLGRTITTLCDEDQARQDVERLALLLGGRACTGYRTVHRHRDGTAVPLVVVAARQLDPAGRVTGAVGLAIALGVDDDTRG